MLNILKMDLYRMFKSKSFYLINIALIVIVLTFGILLRITLSMDYEAGKDSSFSLGTRTSDIKTNDNEITEEQYYAIIEEMKGTIKMSAFLDFQYSKAVIATLLSIFISIFVCSESDTGFIKNLIPIRNSRIKLVASKILVTSIFIIIQGIIAVLVSIVTNFIAVEKVSEIPFEKLIRYMSLQMMLVITFGSLIILISYLFRSKSISIIIGILLSVNIHGNLLNMLDKVINKSNINLTKLSLINNMSLIGENNLANLNNYKSIIIISIIYFILYNLISIIRVRNMEIN